MSVNHVPYGLHRYIGRRELVGTPFKLCRDKVLVNVDILLIFYVVLERRPGIHRDSPDLDLGVVSLFVSDDHVIASVAVGLGFGDIILLFYHLNVLKLSDRVSYLEGVVYKGAYNSDAYKVADAGDDIVGSGIDLFLTALLKYAVLTLKAPHGVVDYVGAIKGLESLLHFVEFPFEVVLKGEKPVVVVAVHIFHANIITPLPGERGVKVRYRFYISINGCT